ncbi:MAG: leucine-rich repeat protein [Treponema sp.]
MKKIIILLFTIFLVISCESSYEYGSYYFTILSDGTVRFDGVHEKLKETISGTFYLPEFIYGRKVTQIGSRAFSYSGITSITIPKNVTKIEDWAFYGCKSLTRVIFEEPNGWKAGSHTLSLTDLQQNAVYLKSTYYSDDWERR